MLFPARGEEPRQKPAQHATNILSSSQVRNRPLAQVAGKIIAAALAVLLGPLLARAIFVFACM